jgi:[ribosomal protein S5]-alanine N-acetyltransferase
MKPVTTPQPILTTPRLRLRPFVLDDAPVVQRLAGAREVASTTQNIPHPYEDGMAQAWISSQVPAWERGELAAFAITTVVDGLVGTISLRIQPAHQRAELGYWIGMAYWGRGYATEAGRAVLGFGFTALGLNRIYATHLTRNPASGRVMIKLGMRLEGCFRQHVVKWGRHEDLAQYAMLRADFESGTS